MRYSLTREDVAREFLGIPRNFHSHVPRRFDVDGHVPHCGHAPYIDGSHDGFIMASKIGKKWSISKCDIFIDTYINVKALLIFGLEQKVYIWHIKMKLQHEPRT